jgi:phosphoribosylformimino-5-aminoimidazole carboxamide ribotide isomerase
MAGTNRALYAQLCERFQMQFIASGGVSDMDDVTHLANSGIYGAIIGKAYYTGAIDLKKAIEVAK